MSIEVKTGALWERKNNDEEEEEVVIRSKLFLNRKAQRDFRVNEIFRKDALDFEKKIGATESDNDEDGVDNVKIQKDVEETKEEERPLTPPVEEPIKQQVTLNSEKEMTESEKRALQKKVFPSFLQ